MASQHYRMASTWQAKRALSAVLSQAGRPRVTRSKDRKFIDWKRVLLRAGDGGDGKVSFKRSGKVRFGPADGGNGGRGGGVVFTAHTAVRTLKPLKNHYHGNAGGHGQGAYQSGKNGKDVVVQVPPGTVIKDPVTGAVLADLLDSGSGYQAVAGGEGGLGNTMFAEVDNRRPIEVTGGVRGDEVVVDVELRTIADVGMVGFPNAGKSTLLRALTRASPAVAAYPFTTLRPHVGVISDQDLGQLAIADLPGLIPGAHDNKGLGHSFLRHIERCSCLLYVLDISSTETIASQYDALQLELKLYNSDLLRSVGLIVVNKMDSLDGRESSAELASLQKESGLTAVPVSGLHQWNIHPLKEALFRIITRTVL